jgi:hypothetical protein
VLVYTLEISPSQVYSYKFLRTKNDDLRIAPPGLNSVRSNGTISRVLQAEEDKDCSDSDPRVHSGRKDVVVLRPPREVAPPNDILEDETDNCPGDVVDGACRRDQASSVENNREARGR